MTHFFTHHGLPILFAVVLIESFGIPLPGETALIAFGVLAAEGHYSVAWVAGLSHMHWWRFLFWNAAGGIAWATAVGLTSYYAGQAAASAIQRYGLYAGAAVTVVVIAGWLGVRYARGRVERRL